MKWKEENLINRCQRLQIKFSGQVDVDGKRTEIHRGRDKTQIAFSQLSLLICSINICT